MVKKTTVRKRSVVARTPAEKFRDNVLVGYPEWVTWSRKLRRIFVCLPSYGVGEEALQSMCEDFDWKYEHAEKLTKSNVSFKKAVSEFVENGYKYRTVLRYPNKKHPIPFQIKWTNLQQVYMMESGITSFIKAETGKISPAESKLIEKAGLLEIEPLVHLPDETPKNVPQQQVDISGESSLFQLQTNLNGK